MGGEKHGIRRRDAHPQADLPPEAVVKGAARSLKADKRHDLNGSEEEYKRVQNVEKAMLNDRISATTKSRK